MPPKRTPVKQVPAKKLVLEEEEDLEDLVYLREREQKELDRLKVQIEGMPQNERDAAAIEVHQEMLQEVRNNFTSLQNRILRLDVNERPKHEDQFHAFNTVYVDLAMRLKRWMRAVTTLPPATSGPAPAGPQQSVVIQQPLPRIIPTFDGKYENWERFKVMFRDVVDKSSEPDRVKLYHLEKALVGSAAGILDEKTIQDGNYDHAWELLTERYEDKRRMVDIHIGGLLNVQKMSKECHVELRSLVECVVGHVENLKFLGQEFSGISEQIVLYVLGHALDSKTRILWEATVKRGEQPIYEESIKFFKERVSVLERCEETNDVALGQRDRSFLKPPASETHFIANTAVITPKSKLRCDLCGGFHLTFKCAAFAKLTTHQRREKAKEMKVCFNCLRCGHHSRSCPSKHSCGNCQRRHHTLLHRQPPTLLTAAEGKPSTTLRTRKPSQNALPVLLPTALVNLRDNKNRPVPCRLLLDNGSQVNFISEHMANRLNTRRIATNVAIAGIGARRTHAREATTVQLHSRNSRFTADVDCFIVPKINESIPSFSVDTSDWPLPEDFQPADPGFNSPGRVDLLLGISMFFRLLKSGQIQMSENLPVIQDTHLGWVVAGSITANEGTTQHQQLRPDQIQTSR